MIFKFYLILFSLLIAIQTRSIGCSEDGGKKIIRVEDFFQNEEFSLTTNGLEFKDSFFTFQRMSSPEKIYHKGKLVTATRLRDTWVLNPNSGKVMEFTKNSSIKLTKGEEVIALVSVSSENVGNYFQDVLILTDPKNSKAKLKLILKVETIERNAAHSRENGTVTKRIGFLTFLFNGVIQSETKVISETFASRYTKKCAPATIETLKVILKMKSN